MPLDGRNWKPETETKPDVFSLEGLIAWLETQPNRKRYDYNDCKGNCVIAQYLYAHGYVWGSGYYSEFLCASDRMFIGDGPKQTFGAALSRARTLLASRTGDAYLAETRK